MNVPKDHAWLQLEDMLVSVHILYMGWGISNGTFTNRWEMIHRIVTMVASLLILALIRRGRAAECVCLKAQRLNLFAALRFSFLS